MCAIPQLVSTALNTNQINYLIIFFTIGDCLPSSSESRHRGEALWLSCEKKFSSLMSVNKILNISNAFEFFLDSGFKIH